MKSNSRIIGQRKNYLSARQLMNEYIRSRSYKPYKAWVKRKGSNYYVYIQDKK